MRMTNWILSILVLVPMALPARAEWQEIEKFEDGMRVYVDRATAQHLIQPALPSPYLARILAQQGPEQLLIFPATDIDIQRWLT